MAIRPLCAFPHEVLQAVAAPVEQFDDSLRALAADLLDTMRAHQGIGIAAPQLGCSLQVVVVTLAADETIFVNPRLEWVAGRTSMVEGCLSLPQRWETVPRWAAVRVRAQRLSGEWGFWEARGVAAITLQHELDHLQGTLFVDRRPLERAVAP